MSQTYRSRRQAAHDRLEIAIDASNTAYSAYKLAHQAVIISISLFILIIILIVSLCAIYFF